MPLEPRVRLQLGLGVLAALGAVAIGVWVHWPWLRAEHGRLPPTLAAGIWAADAVAILWLIWFGVRYAVIGWARPADCGATSRRAVAAGLVLAMGIDLGSALVVAAGEMAGRERAVMTPGEIVGGRPTANWEKAYVQCRFQTPDGALHETWLQVRLTGQPAAVQAVAGRQFPIPVRVWYDPDWPPRCWLDGFNNQEDNRLHWMSLAFLVFQALGLPVALMYGDWRTAAGSVPLYQVIPVAAELLPFFLAAVAKFGEGEF
jgi:hypothetical protein